MIKSDHFDDKIIRDPIYGDIKIPRRFVSLIEARAFQRLRRIRQLATADYVYPGANHTRFSHSIGTYHLMGLLISRFTELFESVNVEYDEEEIDAMLASALLHDIGHGPFSHAFEKIGKGRSHEEWTRRIIEEDREIEDAFNRYFGKGVKKSVLAILRGEQMHDRKFHISDVLTPLVSSELDADRMDYLIRDAYYSGMKYSDFDLEKLISSYTLSEQDGKICVCLDISAVPILDQILLSRYNMYKLIYHVPYKSMTEELISSIVERIAELNATDEKSLIRDIAEDKISLDEYLSLDDISFQKELISQNEHLKDKILSEMLSSLYNRRGFIRCRISNENISDFNSFFDEFEARYGFDLRDKNGAIYTLKNFHAYSDGSTDKQKQEILVAKHNGVLAKYAKVSKLFSDFSPMDGQYWSTSIAYLYVNWDIIKQEMDRDGLNDVIADMRAFVEDQDIRKHLEVEEKYWCVQQNIERAKELLDRTKDAILEGYDAAAISDNNMISDIYFDTDDYALHKGGYSFRRRKCETGYEFSLKKLLTENTENKDGQFVRSEFRIDSADGDMQSEKVSEFLDVHLAEVPRQLKIRNIEVSELKPRIYIENVRSKYKVTRASNSSAEPVFECDISLDSVRYYKSLDDRDNDRNGKDDYQIEIELRTEDLLHRVELRKFVNALKTAISINGAEKSTESKYRRALKLFG